MGVLRARLLGGLTLRWDEAPVPAIPGVAARSLLAYLLTYRQRAHTRDLLAGTFWPDLPEATARRRLSQALWQIRSAVREVTSAKILLTEGDSVQIHPDLSLWLDVTHFERQAAQSERQLAESTIDPLLLAAELYQGEFLAGYYEDWLFPERERLREIFLAIQERLVEGYKGRGEYERALLHARQLAVEDPWREEAHREIMRLCYLLGRDNEALKQFEICRQVLAEELGVEPSASTVALARELGTRIGALPPSDLPEFSPAPAAILLDDPDALELPLVGRKEERATLLAHAEALFQGLGGIVLVEGEAGVGKTRLLRAVASDAEWRGIEVLWSGAQERETATPYGPLVTALAAGLSPLRTSQLAQLVDEIWLQVLTGLLPPLVAALPDLPPPPRLEPDQERDRLVTALRQLLASWAQITPLLLVLEDLHWTGEDALDLLARLPPLLADRGVLIIGSYRSEESRSRPKIWQKLQALDRAGVRQRLELAGLDPATSGELIRRSLGMGQPAPLFEARLHRETGGNPLFVLETLRVLHGEGLLKRDQQGRWSTPWDESTADYAELPLPGAVEQSIARRLAALTAPAQQTLHLAAVLGSRFDFALLAAASDQQPAALLANLRDLIQRRFVDETEQDYCFSHDKVRQVAYEGIEETDRLRLHRQVGGAFEHLHPERVAILAYHWTQAQVWDKAAAYHQRAGDRARGVYANAEAADHYTEALTALEKMPGDLDLTSAYELRLAREAVYALQGQREAQAEDLAAAAALAGQLDDDWQRVTVALRQAKYAEATGNYAQAVKAARASVALARDAAREAEGYLQWGGALLRQGSYEEARQQVALALNAARASSQGEIEADSLRVLGNIAYRLGDAGQAQRYFEHSLHISRQIGFRRGASASLNNLGVVSEELGNLAQARSCYEQSLQISRQIGHRWGESNALSNLGFLLYRQREYGEAKTCYEQSLQASREIGNQLGHGNALINLTLILHEQGELIQAEACSQQALEIYQKIEFRLGEGHALQNLGMISHDLGQYTQARRYLEQSLDLCREIGDQRNRGWGLVILGLILHRLDENEAAHECCQEATRIAQESGNDRLQGQASANLGHVLATLGHLEEATAAYRQALSAGRALGEIHPLAEATAGLANLSMLREDQAKALEYVNQILDRLETSPLHRIEEPFWVYAICYRVLQANQDARTAEVLSLAHTQLQEQAAKIGDAQLRDSFLENPAHHRELLVAYRALRIRQQAGRLTVRLPRASAPTGRPLHDDEYVAVTWTADAPGDESITPKVERRRQRILRLLGEAQAQGAAPRDQDLAEALGVGLRTLRRDMAALRAAGHDLPTRGRLEEMATRSAEEEPD